MRLRVKVALAVVGLSAYVLGAIALLEVGLWASVGPGEQSALERALRTQTGLLVAGGLLLAIGLGVAVGVFFASYVAPLRRLAVETRLIATANPDHRLRVSRPSELRQLADAVNDLADQYRTCQMDVDHRIFAARADLEQERNRLATLMSQLALAVLVCNGEGRVLLYNAAAQQLLEDGGPIGLGRSVFGVVDRSLIGHALDRIRAGSAAYHEAMTTCGGRLLRVHVAEVTGGDEEPSGFVLTLEDMTRSAEASQRRAALLRALTEETRASVATIRAAVESVLDYQEMTPEQRRQFVRIIRDEILALSERVEHTLVESTGWQDEHWSLAEILGSDLTAALQRDLNREHGVPTVVEEPGEEVWLYVDSYAVVQAISQLAGRLHREHGAVELAVALRAGGRWGELDLRWRGDPLDGQMLRAWVKEPLSGGAGLASTLHEVAERHGGELWSSPDDDGRGGYVRMLLPLAEAAPTVLPQPAAPTPTTSWPEYDFALFRRTKLTAAWDDRRLGELAYTVFDTETTGLEPGAGDEIISIGAVRIVNGRLLRRETFEQLVDPRRPVSLGALRIHRISEAILRGQPTIKKVLPAFAHFAEDTVLVGHNVAFDMQFLKLKEASTGVHFTQPVLDTLLLSAALHPDLEDHSMEAIAARLGVRVIGRHTALGDAILTGEIFLRLLQLLIPRGVDTLAAARELERTTYHSRISEAAYAGTGSRSNTRVGGRRGRR